MEKPFLAQRVPLEEIAWEPLIPLIGQANRALAHYDGALYGVPNPEVMPPAHYSGSRALL